MSGRPLVRAASRRVLLADHRAWMRSAIALLLADEPDVEVVGEAVEPGALLEAGRRLRPHVALIAWHLPGLEAAGRRTLFEALRAAGPGIRIVVAGSQPEEREAAAVAGADAFFSLANPPEALLAALRAAAERP